MDPEISKIYAKTWQAETSAAWVELMNEAGEMIEEEARRNDPQNRGRRGLPRHSHKAEPKRLGTPRSDEMALLADPGAFWSQAQPVD